MKKQFALWCVSLILVGILFPCGAVTRTWDGGHETSPNWSEASNWSDDTAPGAGDVALFDGANDDSVYCDVNFNVAKVIFAAGYAGGINLAGVNCTTTAGGLIHDGTGRMVYPASTVTQGDGDSIHIGSGVATPSGTAFDIRAENNLYLDIDKSMAYATNCINDVFVAKGKTLSVIGGVAALYRGSLTLDTATLALTGAFRQRKDNIADKITIRDGSVINGTGQLGIYYETNFTGIDTLTKIKLAGTNQQFFVDRYAGGTEVTMFLSDTLSCGWLSLTSEAGRLIFNPNGQNVITSGTTANDISGAGGVIKVDAGTGKFDFAQSFTTTTYNTSLCTLALGGSTWNIGGDIILGSNTRIVSGTSLVTLDGEGAQKIKLAAPATQHFYDATKSGAGALTDSTTNGIFLDGDFVSTNGTVNLWGGAETAGDIIIDGADANDTLRIGADTVKLTGASSNFHIGSTMQSVVPTSSNVYMATATAGVFDDDFATAHSYNSWIHGSSTVASISGAGGNTQFSSTGVPMVFLGGGTLTQTRPNVWKRTTTGPLITVTGAAPTLNGNAYYFRVGGTGVKVTIPAIAIAATGATSVVTTDAGGTNDTILLTGNIDFRAAGSTLAIYPSFANTGLVFQQGGYQIDATNLWYGSSQATATFTGYFDGAVNVVGAVNATQQNSGTIAVTKSGAWSVGGNYTALSTATYTTTGSTGTFTGAATLTNNGKQIFDSICVASSGTVATADALTAGAVNVASGTFDQSGDSLYAARFFKVASGATYTIDASSKLRVGDNAAVYLGAKSFPLTYTAGSASIYDGGTFANFVMAGSGGDSIRFEPAKRYTFTAFNSDNIKGANGTTSRNAWVSITPTQRDTIDLPAKDTLSRFYVRDQVFLDTVTCTRADSCYSGGGNY